MKTLPPTIFAMASVMMIAAAVPPSHAQDPDPAILDAATDPIPVRIELVTNTLPKSAQADVAEQFRQQFAPLSRKYGLYDSDEPEVVFRFDFGELDKDASVYVVHAEASYLGEVLHRDEARTCVNCTPADLVSDGLRIVSVAVDQVRERRIQALMAAAEAAPEPEPVAAEPPSASDGSSAKPRPRAFGPVGYIGIASTVLGFGSGIAGIFVLDRGVSPDPETNYVTLTDYRPAGKALLGSGLGLMAVGTTLVVVDLAVLAPRRRSNAHAKIDGVAVTIADHTTGVSVRGRF